MYTSLYKLLKTERIEIPIIQRDYAQGRESKVYLRERLLGNLIGSLKNNKTLSLDFVYGTKEHDAMWPLDGQQRLTTLWLLHWYLAVRTNKLSEAKNWLKNFSYETRTSSRDFCKSLCDIDAQAFIDSNMNIVQFITDQTWFYSKYNQDPTVLGMLRTLGGTNITNSENVDITDGIEEFLGTDNDCLLYWERLIAEDCPIRFLYKDMKDDNLPLSDDLYIKMNARGKQLTEFENFKADLIGYAPNPDHPNEKLFNVEMASLIDNEWTDIFWKEASKKGIYKVDDIYYKFLQRYFLDRFIAGSNHSVEGTIKHPLYQILYKDSNNYNGLKEYHEVLTEKTISNLTKLFSRWNNKTIKPHWNKKEYFAFIPEYIIIENDEKGNLKSVETTTINQKERAIFHAIICYYEYNEDFDQNSFSEWIRFAWNIVENSNLNGEEAMVGAIRLFEELRSKSGSIRQFLASDSIVHSSFAARQMEEERFKARLLTGLNADLWKPIIYEAENHGFFKGNISCLIRHSDKNLVEDINCFKLKFSNAKKYFDEKGVKKEYAVPLTKALISSIQRWEQLYEKYLFDINADSWKQNILNNNNPNYYEEVHTLLTADNIARLPFVKFKENEREWNNSANKIKNILALTSFLMQNNPQYGEIVKQNSLWRLHWISGVEAFFPYNKRYLFIFDWISTYDNYSFRRNEFLHHPNIEVDNLEFEGIYWDWTVCFKYSGYSYYWDYKNKVYLLNKQNNPKKRDSNHKNSRNDDYFCIHMDELREITQQGFLIRLTNLAKESE